MLGRQPYGEGLVLRKNPDGSSVVTRESGEGVRHSAKAEKLSRQFCPRCRVQIGLGNDFHVINGQPVHVTPCCRRF